MKRLSATFCIALTFMYSLVLAQNAKEPFLVGLKEFRSLSDALAQPDSVEYLNLKQKKLKEFPNEILTFKNLKALSLRSNKISIIPEEIAKLSKLEYLDLGTNPFEVFPVSVLQLSSLRILMLTNSLITSIPPEIKTLTKLQKLIIWGTECKHLPIEIYEMKDHLQVLDIRLTKIQNEEERDKLEEMLPTTEILFPAPCNCMSNQ